MRNIVLFCLAILIFLRFRLMQVAVGREHKLHKQQKNITNVSECVFHTNGWHKR